MRKVKKITSIVLAVLMVVSMVSVMAVSASAATYVAEVNGTPYETLQAAIDAAQDGDTVELTADITLNPQNISGESAKFGAYITKSITIDGKNHTVTSGVKGVSGDVDVVFKNITINNSQNGAICIITRGGIGSLSLDNVKLDTQGCSSGYNQPLTIGGTQYTQAKVDVKNSIIQTNNEASKYYAIILWNPVDLTIKDSTIKGWACVYQKPFEDGTTDKTEVTIDNSTLVSKGIKGSSNHFAAIMTEESDFSCNVTNSEINVTAAENTYQGVVAAKYGVSGFDVELGTGNDVTMTGDTAIIGYNFDPDNHEIAVSGGTFNKPVDEYYCAEGYIPVNENTHTVGGPFVAKIGDTGYATLQAALDAAQAGDTVTLLKDITDTSIKYPIDPRFAYFVTGKSEITIDGNGHTVNVGGRGFGVAGDGVGADITFKNITINNTTSDGRAIDTRGNKIASLTLDNVTLYTPTGASQALTIGGNQASTTDVNIKDSTLEARYAITTFNPVDMTIDGSEITGWACLNIKAASSSAGSHGSTFTVTDSTLNSTNPFAGPTNEFALIKIEDNDVDVNITGSTLNINGAQNNQAIVSCQDLSFNQTTDNTVTLGDGNTVNFSGDTSYVSVAPTDGEGMVISGGAFSEPVPAELCADTYVPVVNGDGTYGVGIETNPLNPFEMAAADISDGNKFGLTCDYLKGTLLGVQKKEAMTYDIPGSDVTSESHQEGQKNIRFVAVLDTQLIQDMVGADDYGFVLAKVSADKQYSDKIENIKYGMESAKTISAKDTFNNVCGKTDEALAYGDPGADTPYKYVTCAVNDIEDDSKIVARFYYKKGDKVYYAKYAGQNYQYTGCMAAWSDLV